MEQDKTIFGERLKSLRQEKNLTLSELAEVFSTSKSTISRYENNLMNPTREFQLKCASFFNCSIDYLNGLSDIKTIKTSKGSTNLLNEDEYEVPKLNQKDYKDMEKFLNVTIDTLKSQEAFMLNGNIVDDEDIQLVTDAIRIALENAKLHNKIKYTPKKYRKKAK